MPQHIFARNALPATNSSDDEEDEEN